MDYIAKFKGIYIAGNEINSNTYRHRISAMTEEEALSIAMARDTVGDIERKLAEGLPKKGKLIDIKFKGLE